MQVFWCFVFVFLCCENVIVSQNLYEEYSTSITSGLYNNVSATTISEAQKTSITKNDEDHIDQKSVSVDYHPKLDNKSSIPGKEGTFETTSLSYDKLNVTTNFEKVEFTTSFLDSIIYDTTTNISQTQPSYDDPTNGSSETTTITTIATTTTNFEKVESTTSFLESNIYDTTTNTSQTEPPYDDPTNISSETTTITTIAATTTNFEKVESTTSFLESNIYDTTTNTSQTEPPYDDPTNISSETTTITTIAATTTNFEKVESTTWFLESNIYDTTTNTTQTQPSYDDPTNGSSETTNITTNAATTINFEKVESTTSFLESNIYDTTTNTSQTEPSYDDLTNGSSETTTITTIAATTTNFEKVESTTSFLESNIYDTTTNTSQTQPSYDDPTNGSSETTNITTNAATTINFEKVESTTSFLESNIYDTSTNTSQTQPSYDDPTNGSSETTNITTNAATTINFEKVESTTSFLESNIYDTSTNTSQTQPSYDDPTNGSSETTNITTNAATTINFEKVESTTSFLESNIYDTTTNTSQTQPSYDDPTNGSSETTNITTYAATTINFEKVESTTSFLESNIYDTTTNTSQTQPSYDDPTNGSLETTNITTNAATTINFEKVESTTSFLESNIYDTTTNTSQTQPSYDDPTNGSSETTNITTNAATTINSEKVESTTSFLESNIYDTTTNTSQTQPSYDDLTNGSSETTTITTIAATTTNFEKVESTTSFLESNIYDTTTNTSQTQPSYDDPTNGSSETTNITTNAATTINFEKVESTTSFLESNIYDTTTNTSQTQPSYDDPTNGSSETTNITTNAATTINSEKVESTTSFLESNIYDTTTNTSQTQPSYDDPTNGSSETTNITTNAATTINSEKVESTTSFLESNIYDTTTNTSQTQPSYDDPTNGSSETTNITTNAATTINSEKVESTTSFLESNIYDTTTNTSQTQPSYDDPTNGSSETTNITTNAATTINSEKVESTTSFLESNIYDTTTNTSQTQPSYDDPTNGSSETTNITTNAATTINFEKVESTTSFLESNIYDTTTNTSQTQPSYDDPTNGSSETTNITTNAATTINSEKVESTTSFLESNIYDTTTNTSQTQPSYDDPTNGSSETTNITTNAATTTNFEKVESTTSFLESNIYDTTTNTSQTQPSYDDPTNGSSETTNITTNAATTINSEKVESTTSFLESNIYDTTTNTSQTQPSYDDPTNGSSETTNITTNAATTINSEKVESTTSFLESNIYDTTTNTSQTQPSYDDPTNGSSETTNITTNAATTINSEKVESTTSFLESNIYDTTTNTSQTQPSYDDPTNGSSETTNITTNAATTINSEKVESTTSFLESNIYDTTTNTSQTQPSYDDPTNGSSETTNITTNAATTINSEKVESTTSFLESNIYDTTTNTSQTQPSYDDPTNGSSETTNITTNAATTINSEKVESTTSFLESNIYDTTTNTSQTQPSYDDPTNGSSETTNITTNAATTINSEKVESTTSFLESNIYDTTTNTSQTQPSYDDLTNGSSETTTITTIAATTTNFEKVESTTSFLESNIYDTTTNTSQTQPSYEDPTNGSSETTIIPTTSPTTTETSPTFKTTTLIEPCSRLGNNVSTTTISEPQETTITKNDDVHIDQKSVSVDDEPKLDNKPSIPGKEGTFETTSISYEKLNVTTNFEKVESTTSVLESNIYDTTTNTSKTVLSYDDSTNGSSETTTITTIEAITINFEKVETTTWFLESNIYDTTNTSQTEPSYDDPTNGSSETTTITTTISPTTTETSTTFEPTTTVEPCSSPDEINVTINNILENEISLNINAVLQESDCTFICLTKININCTVFPENSTIYPWTKLYGSATLELNDTNWYTVTIDNLSPFTNYKCVVQDFPSNDVSVQTLPAVTSPPSQLNVIVLSPQEVNISWQPPEFVSAVLKGYRVNITTWEVAQDGHLWNDCSSLDETSYTVNETVFIFTSWPDFIYNCTVEADSNAGYSEAISCSFSTPPDVPPPLEQVSVKVSEQEIGFKNIVMSPLVSWILPCDSKGPVQEIYLDIFGHYNLDVSRTIEYRNIIIPISNDIQEYVHSIPSVPAAYKFNFSILLSGTAGRGNVYEGLFETNDNYPSEPHINQTMKNSRNFTITWTEPANYPGKILDYTLDIIGKGANWPVTDHCDVSDASYSTSDHTLNREYINTRVLPDANYEIRLVAQTSRGDGNSTSSNITSEMSYPDYVSISIDINSYSNAETYNDTVTVKLVAGCFNGQFKSYDIRLVGTRDEHIIDKEDREVKEYDKTEHMFILQPEYFYVVVVTVSNEQYNRSNSLNFTAPSGVPKMDSSTLSNIKITPSQTETTLTLEKDYFDNSRGTVKYIAIIVSDQNITGGEFSKWEDNSMWPDPEASANVYYQATPMFWNPFANVDSIEFNLGANKSCEDEEQFCNKPLKPGTQYYVFVRVFNDNYYRNSMPIVFFTDEFTRVGLILGVIFGILALSLAGAFAFMLWRKGIIKISPREKQGYSGTLQESSEVLLSKSYEKWPIFRSFVQLDVQGPKTEIPIDKFLEYCTNLEHNSDVVKSQWEELVEQSKLLYNEYSTHFSTLPENKRKNRYTNILPFDHSRVKLNIDEDDEICSDYINASYIKGYSNQNEYIATQGPLSGTCKDFWKMILQENVKIIVMVSKFIENNKDKCYKYFPNNRETMLINGDDIEVRCSTELHFGYYCIRTLQVKKDLKQVSVTHMQFLEWPDFGVPDSTESMLHFCQQFKERWASEGGMAVVHCSAGVGRTGTLIATDILLRRLKDGKNIDVFNTILELRKQRMSMVQTDKQYVYIHQLIKSMLEFPMSDELNNQTEHVYENIEIKNNTDIVESSF